ncbi:MAG: thioredoxin-dependent thiol peroxidase [Alphaproteobacteria bacterium]
MTELSIGDQAPDFTLPTDGGGEITLSAFQGQRVVLYFYPKDNTPGCTTESCDFRDHKSDFEGLNAQIIGISKDSVKKHDNFKSKYDLNFPLASDENSDVCERYGVWAEKSMYGKTFMGIERSTFLIDENGRIAKIWRTVKVKDHVAEVRAELESMQKAA